jgi:glutathione S-transferase
MIKPMMGMGETDEVRLAEIAATEQPEVFGYLESQLPEQGFLFGDTLSLADLALANPFINGGYGGFTLDADSWPRTAAWLERVKSEPVLVKLLAAEKALMEQMAA